MAASIGVRASPGVQVRAHHGLHNLEAGDTRASGPSSMGHPLYVHDNHICKSRRDPKQDGRSATLDGTTCCHACYQNKGLARVCAVKQYA